MSYRSPVFRNPHAITSGRVRRARRLRGGHIGAPACGALETHPDTGLSWEDMPGKTHDRKKMHFFFHRRGMSVEEIVRGDICAMPESVWA